MYYVDEINIFISLSENEFLMITATRFRCALTLAQWLIQTKMFVYAIKHKAGIS